MVKIKRNARGAGGGTCGIGLGIADALAAGGFNLAGRMECEVEKVADAARAIEVRARGYCRGDVSSADDRKKRRRGSPRAVLGGLDVLVTMRCCAHNRTDLLEATEGRCDMRVNLENA